MFQTQKPSNDKPLALLELIAIAIGGMIGGGIFSILGISVEKISNLTPLAIAIGSFLAFLASYSYIKLALYYRDEGAAYSFFKKTFPQSHFASSAIGWLVSFGYISTLALYAFTFASYFASLFPNLSGSFFNKIVAGVVLLFFTLVNLISVKGMGKIEDLLVYSKVILLLIIGGIFIGKGKLEHILPLIEKPTSFFLVFTVAAITFVSFEGFQLVIHAYQEVENPDKNIPRAIYTALFITVFIYIILAIGALLALPKDLIIRDKEFALASGSTQVLGGSGLVIVIAGALLATSSAISGTLFGASRLMARIAEDGYLPTILTQRIKGHIPKYAILFMGIFSYILILSGGLETILQFGSITFIIVSLLMAYANLQISHKTQTKPLYAIAAVIFLAAAAITIVYYEFEESPRDLTFILVTYGLLVLCSVFYAKSRAKAS